MLPWPAVRRSLIVILLFAVGVAGPMFVRIVQGSANAAPSGTTTAPAVSSPYCRSNVLGGVHDPDRLEVKSPCAILEGIVVRAPKLNVSDGDVTFNVRPDGPFVWMANTKNLSEGGIHVEVVPADQSGCTAAGLARISVNDLGACTGANVTLPPLNAHVRVIAPFVFDRWVGWNEMHPAWKVEILTPSGTPPPERHSFAAGLRGAAVPAHRGAALGRGNATLTLTVNRLCWQFTKLQRIGVPTRAIVRGVSSGGSRVAVALGDRFRARGCTTVPPAAQGALLDAPRRFAVVVFARGYARGAIQGALVPTTD